MLGYRMKNYLVVCLLLTCSLLAGCASSITHGINYTTGKVEPAFYSGVVTDSKIISQAMQCTWYDDCANRDTAMISLAPLAVLDFPLSAIVDTLLVPIDAIIYYHK